MRTNIENLVKIREEIYEDKRLMLELKKETYNKYKEENDFENRREFGRELGQIHHNLSVIQGQIGILDHLLNYDTPLERINKILVPKTYFI